MFKEQETLEDTRGNDQETQDEELYQRLFKKIARDFIYIISLSHIGNYIPENVSIDYRSVLKT